MKLEDQVCSSELAKRLKELGLEQKSLFWHWQTKIELCGVENDSINMGIPMNEYSKEIDPRYHFYSAFTVAELGEMLPATMMFEKHRNGEWVCIDNINPIGLVSNSNEANARAKMLIYLLENGLIKND